MGDRACTVAPSLTLRVTIGSLTLRITNGTFTLRVTDDAIRAVGHAMVTRYVSEEAAERRPVSYGRSSVYGSSLVDTSGYH
jgi:hypothetical protein